MGEEDLADEVAPAAHAGLLEDSCTPAGFEDLVREMSVPAASRTLPPPTESPPDMELIAAIAVAHGCELLA